MTNEIQGMVDYNPVMEIIDKVIDNDQKIYFFSRKQSPGRSLIIDDRFTRNIDSWVLTGTDARHTAQFFFNETSTEIPFKNIEQDKIIKDSFDLESSDIMKYYNIKGVYDNQNTVIQVANRKGDIFEYRVYSITEIMGKKELELITRGFTDVDAYKQNFAFGEDFEYGHVSLITSVRMPNFQFKSEEFQFEFIEKNGEIIDEKKYNKIFKSLDNPRGDIKRLNTFNQIVTLRLMLDVFDKKGLKSFQPKINKVLNFYLPENIGLDSINCYQLEDIQFIRFPDPEKKEYQIWTYPFHTEGISSNKADPLNLWTYNVLVTYQHGNSSIINGYEAIDMGLSTDEVSNRRRIATDANIQEVSSLLIISEEGLTTDKVKQIHTEYYDRIFTHLKSKWDKIFKRYKELYKPKPIDENFFAILFIQKYFIINTSASSNLRELVPNNPIKVIAFFEEVFGSFDNFFGENRLSKFIATIASFDSIPFTWNNKRLEKGTYSLKSLRNIKPYGFDIISYFMPSELYNKIISAHSQSKRWYNGKQLVIINDSKTKHAWKKKTRVFIEQLVFSKQITGKITVIDYQDKFQGMLWRRLANEVSHFIKYSEFEKDIEVDKKKSTTTQPSNSSIKIFPGNYVTNAKSGNGIAQNISSVNTDNTVFVEYAVTKREIRFKDTTYSLGAFDTRQWYNLIYKYTGKYIAFISKVHLKKLKEYYGKDLLLLEDFIEDPEFNNSMKRMHYDYLFMPVSNYGECHTSKAITFLVREFFSHIYSKPTLKNEHESIVWDTFFRIMNSFNSEIFNVFTPFMDFLYKEEALGTTIRTYHEIEGILLRKILIRPSSSYHTSSRYIDRYIYSKIDEPEELPIMIERITDFGKTHEEVTRRLFNTNNDIFNFGVFLSEFENLLLSSNMLNLSKEETEKKFNLFYAAWLSRWQLTVDIINDSYQIVKKG